MLNSLKLAAFLFLSLYLLLSLFLAIMSLYRAQLIGTLPAITRKICMPLLAFGYFWDFACNMIPATIVFGFDPPREWLVTARLQRYVDGPDCWRRRLALWFAVNLLDPFDPKGYHVKQPTSVPPALVDIGAGPMAAAVVEAAK